jgi:PAS domain S-box-containing protein
LSILGDWSMQPRLSRSCAAQPRAGAAVSGGRQCLILVERGDSMTRNSWRRLWPLATGGGFLIFYAIIAAFIHQKISTLEIAGSQRAADNLGWAGGQFQTEFYRFEHRLAALAAGAPGAGREDVAARYDSLVAQLAALAAARPGEIIAGDSELTAAVERARAGLSGLGPAVAQIAAGDPAPMMPALATLADLEHPVARIADRLAAAAIAERNSTETTGRKLTEWLGIVLLGHLGAFLVLGALLGRQLATLRRTQVTLESANAELVGAQASLQTGNSALRASQAALHESRAILQSVIDNIPSTIGITDRERRIVLMNKALQALYGVRLADVVGRSVDEVRPARYRSDTAISDHRRVFETGEPILGREDHYTGERGEETWITSIVPIRDEQERVKYVLRTNLEVPQLARAYEALAESRALLLEAQRQAKVVAWYQDLDSPSHTVWSETAADVLGLGVEELGPTDADYLRLVHPNDREHVREAYARIRQSRATNTIEYRLCRPDGTTIWAREVLGTRPGQPGTADRLVGTVQDITDQKRAEAALRESEAYLRAAQQRAGLAYWHWDLGTAQRYIWAGEGAAILGLPVAELPSNDEQLLKLVDARDRERVAADFARSVAGDADLDVEYRIRRPDGKIAWIRELDQVQRDDAGKAVRVIATIQDVTEQKQIEEALRDSEARFRSFMDHAPFDIQVKDLDGRYLMINRAAEAAWGGSASEILGRRIGELSQSAGVLEVEAMERDVVRSGEPLAREVHFTDLGPEWTYEVKFPIKDAGGQTVAIGGVAIDISDRKKAQMALAESEARLRGFMDNTPVEMIVKDLDGRYLMINRCAERNWSMPAAVLLGKRSVEIPGFEGTEIAEAMDREVIETGRPVSREVDFSKRGTEWRYEMKFPIRDSAGRLLAIGGVGVDIGDLKRTQDSLRHSEELLQEVVLVSNIGIFDHDHRADTIYWSPEQRKNYGFTVDEAVTLPKFLECVYPEDRERIFAAVQRAHDPAGDGRFDVEHRIIRRDGAIRWVDTRSQTFFDGAGGARRPVRTIGAVVDITARKNVELALRDSEARLRRAQQQARLAYWNWRFDVDLIEWSPGSGAILGLPDDELPAKAAGFYALVHPGDRGRMAELYQEVKEGLDQYTAEYRLVHPGDNVVWVREIGEVERDSSGRRGGVAGTVQDITERHDLEEQLRQVQKMEAVGQLTGGVAHDFNNLLAVILGNLDLVGEQQLLDAQSREKIDIAVRAALRGAELTHRLLAFARRQPLAPKVMQIDGLIAGMHTLLRRLLGPTIEIDFQPAEDLWLTEVDSTQLETSLLNLALNARDAMPHGGKLTIETANVQLDEDYARLNPEVMPGDYVLVSVSDTGIGMSDEVKARAFDPFFTTKEFGKGTGLGLSMVYGFVKQSGGHIKLYSEVDHGTTINIYLPRTEAASAPAANEPVEIDESEKRATILVVEDDQDVQALVVESLEGLGYKVLSAADGPSAFVAFDANPQIDLLLTDVILPGPMDGRAIARKACAQRPGLEVVYMSGYAPSAIVHGGRLDAGVLHISKPFRRIDLARIVRTALKRGGK